MVEVVTLEESTFTVKKAGIKIYLQVQGINDTTPVQVVVWPLLEPLPVDLRVDLVIRVMVKHLVRAVFRENPCN